MTMSLTSVACRMALQTQRLFAVFILLFGAQGYSATIDHSSLHDLGIQSCNAFKITSETELKARINTLAREKLGTPSVVSQSDIEFRQRTIGQRLTITLTDSSVLEIQFIEPPGRPVRTVLTEFKNSTRHDNDQPSLQLVLDAECAVQQAQEIKYSQNNTAELIQSLQLIDGKWVADDNPVWLNPPLPAFATITPPRLRVAMVDSGVNYRLPVIANSLARDKSGRLIGYDFWDMDDKPYDANTARSPYFVQRHGTRTASIIINEAPGIAIVPYRYPRPDMSRMKSLIEHAHTHDVRVIGMPLGSNDYKSWSTFDKAARAHPEILFVVSAGNNGRDIDINAVYPAAMDTPNMIVVTSANDFVQPAERTNYGRIAVDYLVPAEQINALDYDGSNIEVSGSSYAVSRVVALAARLLNRQPDLTTRQLMEKIRQQSIRARTGRYVSAGYLGDPLASPAELPVDRDSLDLDQTTVTKYRLSVNINIMDHRWSIHQITTAVEELNTLFEQCSVSVQIDSMDVVDAPDYLRDLATGHMLTLRRKLGPQPLAIYFGRDTKMQPQFDAEAFGEGNTSSRRWMTNTLWLTFGIRDTGIALAHELFHIVANDGSHTQRKNNLMHERTDPSHTTLDTDQCEMMQSNGLESGLLAEN